MSMQPQPAEQLDEAHAPEDGADAEQEEAKEDPGDLRPAATQATAEAHTARHTPETGIHAASGGTGAAEDEYDPWVHAPVVELAPPKASYAPPEPPSAATPQEAFPVQQPPQPEAPQPQAAPQQSTAQAHEDPWQHGAHPH
eukprot:2151475-Alexandrium_andersonii.AAC.1